MQNCWPNYQRFGAPESQMPLLGGEIKMWYAHSLYYQYFILFSHWARSLFRKMLKGNNIKCPNIGLIC
jgi:hypothetical protein